MALLIHEILQLNKREALTSRHPNTPVTVRVPRSTPYYAFYGHLRHVGEERAEGLQGMIPEIVKFSAQSQSHLGVNFGNSERICLIGQEVAIVGGLEMNFQI